MRRFRLGFPEWGSSHRPGAVGGPYSLPAERRTERDGGHLVQERNYSFVGVGAFKVAAASAAFARDALRDGVEGDEGDGRVGGAD